jgi:hypothetical protein
MNAWLWIVLIIGLILLLIVRSHSKKTMVKDLYQEPNENENNNSSANVQPKSILQDLTPAIPTRLEKYPDIIQLIKNIQDYYYINDNAYIDLLHSLDVFIQLHDQIMFDQMIYCRENLQVAIEFVRNALNNLQSMIYQLKTDPIIMTKFHQDLNNLKTLTDKYVQDMINKCSVTSTIVDVNGTLTGPKPFNYFDTQLVVTNMRTRNKIYPKTDTFDFY